MRNDVKSNYTFAESLPAISQAAGALNGAAVDHALAGSVSFLISVGTVGASGTIDMKSQYSDDNASWTDYPAADEAGNDDAITQIIAAGSALLHIPNPRGRYSRIVATTAVAASVVGVSHVLGPLRHIAA
jgi:hypothetical protein